MNRFGKPLFGWAATVLLIPGVFAMPHAAAATVEQTFTVTATMSNTLDWTVDGQPDPTLVLIRGRTYVFALTSVPINHPFAISDDGINLYNDGVSNNQVTGTTQVTFTVPLSAPDLLHYICTFHPEMIGAMQIVDASTGDSIFTDGFEATP